MIGGGDLQVKPGKPCVAGIRKRVAIRELLLKKFSAPIFTTDGWSTSIKMQSKTWTVIPTSHSIT